MHQILLCFSIKIINKTQGKNVLMQTYKFPRKYVQLSNTKNEKFKTKI